MYRLIAWFLQANQSQKVTTIETQACHSNKLFFFLQGSTLCSIFLKFLTNSFDCRYFIFEA
jgi:hypothetical protein